MANTGGTLILSPHLDDAVLSLGAVIQSLTGPLGSQVAVLTLFSGGPVGGLTAAADADRARNHGIDPLPMRRAEDRAAADLLGFEPYYADLPELVYRRRADGRPRVEALEDRLLFADLEAEDEATVETVAKAIAAGVTALRPQHVFVPVGVGRHIDHTIVRTAADQIGVATAYYQDMPYAIRGDDVVVPPDTMTVRWNVSADDVEHWLNAIAAYETQLDNLFPQTDWRAQFRRWVAGPSATYFQRI